MKGFNILSLTVFFYRNKTFTFLMRTLVDPRARRIKASIPSIEKFSKQVLPDKLSGRKQEEEICEKALSPAAEQLLQYRLQGVDIATLAQAERYSFSVEKDDQHFHWGRLMRKLSIRLSDERELQAWLVTFWQKTSAEGSEQHILYADPHKAAQFYERLALSNSQKAD